MWEKNSEVDVKTKNITNDKNYLKIIYLLSIDEVRLRNSHSEYAGLKINFNKLQKCFNCSLFAFI